VWGSPCPLCPFTWTKGTVRTPIELSKLYAASVFYQIIQIIVRMSLSLCVLSITGCLEGDRGHKKGPGAARTASQTGV
jgi:hypothetical protein